MYYGRIPPHIALGDSVTISKEAQQKLSDSEPETINVEFQAQGSLENSFVFFFIMSASFVVGTIIGTVWNWYG